MLTLETGNVHNGPYTFSQFWLAAATTSDVRSNAARDHTVAFRQAACKNAASGAIP